MPRATASTQLAIMISSSLSLARQRLLLAPSNLLSTRLAVAARVDRWAMPGVGGPQLAGLASLAGHRHLPKFNVSTVRITEPNVTLVHRQWCSSCGCLTGKDTNDDNDDDDEDYKYDDHQRGPADSSRNLASRVRGSSSGSRSAARLPGSGRSCVLADKTATTRDESIEFRPKSPLVTLFDRSTNVAREHQRPQNHHLQGQQEFSRDVYAPTSCLESYFNFKRRPGQQQQQQQRRRQRRRDHHLDNNQLAGDDDNVSLEDLLRAPCRNNTGQRNSVMVKPDPERRSVVHIVKSPSSRSQQSQSPRPVATVVDEEQLHRRFLQSVSERGGVPQAASETQREQDQEQSHQQQQPAPQPQQQQQQASQPRSSGKTHLNRDRDRSVSSSTSSGSKSDSLGLPVLSRSRAAADNEPPPAAIIIPPSVARSLSMRRQQQQQQSSSEGRPARDPSTGGGPRSPDSQGSAITREQLEYGPLLRPNEVQVLYRSPETFSGTGSSSLGLGSISSLSSTTDRQAREEQNRQVAPHLKQSPIAFMSMNPAYEVHNRPLILEYPATVENLRMNNTGFCWEVKIPYQLSASTSLSGAHLASTQRFRLDQFHCHWGDSCDQGSEHTIDNRHYSAELHFVHYNMEKYHTMSKAARHPDGLVVVGVLIDAQPNYRNHAELEKVVSNLKSIQLKGEHSYIKQVLRIDNLLPANRSYWSYPGSLTTPPYLESVTWFVLKQPIKCNTAQIERFRNIKSTIRNDDDDRAAYIRSNCRKTQPLNGRTIVTYDEPVGGGR